ncbi:AAA family ATPase [Nocardia otitidiscaviarum]|uniref:AAA family ATPase n=1 Tax=Nocardia otitidiscaviarum TaxID=1823 RepID=UPI000694824E|nr:AAA family ATPase [Nocardia otitidiscaviarum]
MLTVITGPPAAGKTTYVRDHAAPGDIIIDLDAIAIALGSRHGHNHPRDIKTVAQAARTAAIRAAANTRATTWLIHTAPTTEQLATYRAQGARIITVDPGEATTRTRITAERTPEAHDVADRWYLTPGVKAGMDEARRRFG